MSNRVAIFMLLCITCLGGYLRFAWLGVRPLWIDEVIFFNMAKNIPFQEFIPILIQKIFNSNNEFWIRFPFALCGTLTIPAVYYVIKDKIVGLTLALFVATFPLFVFWSTMARPYAFAGLFMVLSWKSAFYLIPAILTTPFAIIGWRPWASKNRIDWIWIPAIVLCMFMIRQDGADKNFLNPRFLYEVRRIYYLPLLVMVLYCGEYVFSFLRYKAFPTRLRQNR